MELKTCDVNSPEYLQILPNLFSALIALAAGVALSEQLLILFHWHLT